MNNSLKGWGQKKKDPFSHRMVMLMMVVIVFVCDQREDCFHQVKVVDTSHHYQHLVYVVWCFVLVIGM